MSASSRARPSPNLRSSPNVTHTRSFGFMGARSYRSAERFETGSGDGTIPGRSMMLITTLVLAILAAVAIPTVGAQELTFSVAISMKEATEELGRRCTQGRPGVVLRYNFGSSGDLQKQIEAGGARDPFVFPGPRAEGGRAERS